MLYAREVEEKADLSYRQRVRFRDARLIRSSNRVLSLQHVALLFGILLVLASSAVSQDTGSGKSDVSQSITPGSSETTCDSSTTGSPYIPIDSWVYPAVLRLYSMGYVHGIYLGMRPWTRSVVCHLVDDVGPVIEDARSYSVSSIDEAQRIYDALRYELRSEEVADGLRLGSRARLESTYSAVRAMSGVPLRDSFHLGSSIINDYGRPYTHGVNSYSGISGSATTGRFSIYVRGELQATPSATGYSAGLAQQLSVIDLNTSFFSSNIASPPNLQATIPAGPIAATTRVRLLEAYVSAQYLNNVVSFGKQDEWLGPAQGGSMAYSNNAENIYAFHINRIEPLNIPLLSRVTGPFRYEFLVGPLKGHVYPADPWVHVEKISFRPTDNLEFGFERTAIWGGKGHTPITVHSFLKSFFSFSAPDPTGKVSRNDPGARFGAFDFSYRLPYVRNWLTLYADSEVHDDVSPIDAPRRASWRPGLALSHVPGVPKLDLRAEATYTDPPITNSEYGHFMYWEVIQVQGYTNQGQIFGDWIGREGKGGQFWVTYHSSGNEWFQVALRHQKVAKDFIPGGTTLSAINFQAVKRIRKDLELKGDFQFERWKAPIYLPGQQNVTSTSFQFTWFPERKINF